MSEIEPKKMVSRNVALIAIGLICVILIAGIAGVVTYYTQNIQSKDNIIAQLNSENAQLHSSISSLQSQISNFTSILAFNNRELLYLTRGYVVQKAGSYDSWNFSIPYAGYLYIEFTPPSNDTYIRVIDNPNFWVGYNVQNVQYTYETQGTPSSVVQSAEVFVLPSSNTTVIFGNNMTSGQFAYMLEIDYYY